MKMSRVLSRIVAALLLALLLPILAACGGSPPNIAAPTQPPSTTAPKPTAASVPTAVSTSAPAAPATAAPTGTTAAPAPSPAGEGGPLKTPYLEFGVVDHLYYTDRGRVLILTNNAGFDWVRQQIQWKDIEGPQGNYAWGELDNIVSDVAAHNLKLLISITKEPSFYNETNGLPQDPKSMGDFVEAMMQHYGNKINAVEIWNEQN